MHVTICNHGNQKLFITCQEPPTVTCHPYLFQYNIKLQEHPTSMHDDKLQMDDTTHDAFSSITNGASPNDTMYRAFSSMNGTST